MAVHHSVLSALLLSAVAAATLSRDVRQCPDETRAGCSPPKWAPRWDTASSSYVYCFRKCPLSWLANHTEIGLFGGVVGVDHYWTHQGMPCKDGKPQEFKFQDEFAKATKATFPKSLVLEYRITDAVPYDPIVHDLMESNPEYFVRWHHAPNNNMSICTVPAEHETGRPGDNCSWPIRAAAYDWSKPEVRDWYLQNIIKPTMVHGDGAWIDGDGPDNGCFECSGNYRFNNVKAPYPANNASEVAAFCDGEAAVVTAAQKWLIENGGFDYNCFDFVESGLPAVGDTPEECAHKVRSNDFRHAHQSSAAVVLYGSRTRESGYTDDTTAQAVATFMLVRGPHWFFGAPVENTLNATAMKYVLSDYGPVVSNMTEPSPNVFKRTFERAVITLDCNTFQASFDAVQ
eukprot:m.27944 g.27944  ORF g.27944 m.27944 type:complete len:401 (-) comp8677_c0_seq1:65-1267(-)